MKAFVNQIFDFKKMGAIKEISSTVYSTQRFDRFGGFLVYFPWSSIFGEGRGKFSRRKGGTIEGGREDLRVGWVFESKGIFKA